MISFDFDEIADRGDDLVRFQRDRRQGRRFLSMSKKSSAGAMISFKLPESIESIDRFNRFFFADMAKHGSEQVVVQTFAGMAIIRGDPLGSQFKLSCLGLKFSRVSAVYGLAYLGLKLSRV